MASRQPSSLRPPLRVLIPLAGKGERFAAAGFSEPKPLVPVAGRPLLFHLLDRLLVLERDLASAAPPEVCVVYAARLDEAGFAERVSAAFPGVRLVRLDGETRGAAETVLMGLRAMAGSGGGWAAGRVVVMDGDALYTGDVLDRVAAAPPDSSGLVYFAQDPADGFSGYSYVRLGEGEGGGAEVTEIAEKRRISGWANTGLAWFDSGARLEAALAELVAAEGHRAAAAERIPPGPAAAELYMSSAIAAMMRAGHPFQGLRIAPEAMVCLGTPAQVAAYTAGVRAYLFDLDGTLLDTEPAYRAVWRRLMRDELGLAEASDDERADALFELHVSGNDDATALRGLAPEVGASTGSVSAAKDRLFLAEVRRGGGTAARPLPGALAFVRRLRRESACLVAVVSNGNRGPVETLLRDAGLLELCHAVVVGPECARPKPHPDPFLAALAELGGVDAGRAAIFEDSRAGLLAAQAVFPGLLVQITGAARTPWRFSAAVPAVRDFEDPALAPLLAAFAGPAAPPAPEAHRLLAAHFGPGVPLRIAAAKAKGGFIADVLAVDAGEARLVFKYETRDTHSSLAAVAQQLRLYEREYQFYEHVRDAVAARTALRTPRCMGLVRERAGAGAEAAGAAIRGVLLERLEAPAFVAALDLNEQPVEVALRVVDRIAEMHARFLGCGEREFPFLRRADDPLFLPGWGDFVRERWPRFADKWRGVLSAEQLALGERMATEFERGQRQLAAGPGLTLIHGDVKSANIFFHRAASFGSASEAIPSEAEPYFIDWQYIAYGKGAQDLVFFIIESLDEAHIRAWTGPLCARYLASFLAHAPPSLAYTRAELDRDVRLAAGYFPFFVAMWFGTLRADELIDADFPHRFIRRLFAFLGAAGTA